MICFVSSVQNIDVSTHLSLQSPEKTTTFLASGRKREMVNCLFGDETVRKRGNFFEFRGAVFLRENDHLNLIE